MGCFRFIFTIFPILFTALSIVLSVLVCVGNTKTSDVLSNIYLINFDLRDLNVSSIIGASSNSLLSDISLTDLSDLGIPDYFSVGLWNYCDGDYDSDNGNKVTTNECSSTKPMFYLDPSTILQDAIGDKDITIDLPQSFQDLLNKYYALQRAIFITLLIGICLTFILFLIGLISMFIPCFCFILIIGLLAILTLLFSVAASTGLYIYIRNQINDSFGTYGVKAHLSVAYYALGYSSVVSLIIAVILFAFISLCGGLGRASRVGRNRQLVQQYPVQTSPEEKGLMEYTEPVPTAVKL